MAFVVKRNDKDENNSTEKKRKGKFFKTNGTISQKCMIKLTKSGLSLKANACKRTV